jgi:hypothetical protein
LTGERLTVYLAGIPYLRILAGAIFVLAGLFAYFGITFGVSIALVLVIAGTVVIILTLVGHRAYPIDIAVFVVALIILGGIASGYVVVNNNNPISGPSTIQYTYLRTGATSRIDSIFLLANTNSSSINIQFSDNSSLLYQVQFIRGSSGIPFFLPVFGGRDTYDVTNVTRGGMLFLNASASYRSISVTLPSGYLTNINASTGAGSIKIVSSHEENIGVVSLSTGAGSIDANISSNHIRGIALSTGAGSANLKSDFLGPNQSKVPISISTGSGSASLDVKVPKNSSVSIGASTGFGSISHTLSSDFSISQSSNSNFVASEGNVNSTSTSFEISLSTGAGSVSITAQTV